ncbi:hypothetical protein [Pseudoalteromonas luteoviolacea]|nr:hypothetical protein [Pseudoalteromonas luteoviolacea]
MKLTKVDWKGGNVIGKEVSVKHALPILKRSKPPDLEFLTANHDL